ncbi:MAG: MFS transporter [Bacteroidales bacterium]|nr:MFS transporter [Bacteroidales bacterium]
MTNLKILLTTRKYIATAQLFLSLSLIFGTWVTYIPFISTKVGLSKGDLGIVLLFGAIGSIFTLPFGKKLVSKIGEGKLALITTSLYAISMLGNFIADSFFLLCVCLFVNGLSSALMQIASNSIVSTLEKKDNVSIMSSCHGFFSFGGLIAAGFGTMILIAINNPLIHIILMVSIVLILQAVFASSYLPYKTESHVEKNETKHYKKPIKNVTLWGLASVALCVMLTEGAIADWSGLFLRDVVLVSPNIVGLGYAGFSIAMTLGRFVGDNLSSKLGAWNVIVWGLALSIAGFILVLWANTFPTLSGFLLIGFGFSTIVPEVYRLSTNVKGVHPSSGISFMAGAGYFGFLTGPVLLGAIAENFGLKTSFLLLLALVTLGIIIATFIRRKKALAVK